MGAFAKGFSPQTEGHGFLLSSKVLAVVTCVLFIASLTGYYLIAESGFNPNPQKQTLPAQGVCSLEKGPCPGYQVTNITLKVLTRTDIRSQQVSFTVTPTQQTLERVVVYLEDISLGSVAGPFAVSNPKLVSLGVPTTISVRVGDSYMIFVDGVYFDSHGNAADYWESVNVIASGG